MPGLLRSSQATGSGGGGDILLARLGTRQRQGFLLRIRVRLYESLSFEGLRIIRARVALTCALFT